MDFTGDFKGVGGKFSGIEDLKFLRRGKKHGI